MATRAFLLWAVVVVWLCGLGHGQEIASPVLPHPSLTLTPNMTVVTVTCRPPSLSTHVYSVQLLQEVTIRGRQFNESLVRQIKSQPLNITAKARAAHTEARFQGRWDSTAELVVTMLLLEPRAVFFCAGEYGSEMKIADNFSSKVQVDTDPPATDRQGPTESQGGYSRQSTRALRVQVTWRKPTSPSDFFEASVSMQRDGEMARTLFLAAPGHRDFVKRPAVLLASVRPLNCSQGGAACSVTLYLKADSQARGPESRYHCRVIFRQCQGSHDPLCVCPGDSPPTSSPLPAVDTTSHGGSTGLVVGLVVVAVLLVVALAFIVYLLCKNRKQHKSLPGQRDTEDKKSYIRYFFHKNRKPDGQKGKPLLHPEDKEGRVEEARTGGISDNWRDNTARVAAAGPSGSQPVSSSGQPVASSGQTAASGGQSVASGGQPVASGQSVASGGQPVASGDTLKADTASKQVDTVDLPPCTSDSASPAACPHVGEHTDLMVTSRDNHIQQLTTPAEDSQDMNAGNGSQNQRVVEETPVV